MLAVWVGALTAIICFAKVGLIMAHVFSEGRLFPWMRHILGDMRPPKND